MLNGILARLTSGSTLNPKGGNMNMTNETSLTSLPAATKAFRRRANVTRTSRGFSVEVTVESTGHTQDEIMAELRSFFAAVDQAYPQGGFSDG
jgi:hypothetical protein